MFTTKLTRLSATLAFGCVMSFGVVGMADAQDDKKQRPPKTKVEVPQPQKKDPPPNNDKGGKKNDGKKGDGELRARFFRRFVV